MVRVVWKIEEEKEKKREREKSEENKKVEIFHTNVSGNNIFQRNFSCQFGVGEKNILQCREIG